MICDKCGKEYTTNELGNTSTIGVNFLSVNSCHETSSIKCDLCHNCSSEFNEKLTEFGIDLSKRKDWTLNF